MKTNEQKSKVKTRATAATGIALLLLIVYAPKTAAQATNTFPDNGSAGIGTTSPGNINGSWPLNAPGSICKLQVRRPRHIRLH